MACLATYPAAVHSQGGGPVLHKAVASRLRRPTVPRCDRVMRPIPETLRRRPFSRHEAEQAGVTSRMLDGDRFVRVFPNVWRCRDHEMTHADVRAAAKLALPDTAHLTGISRIQALGLDFGPRYPVRFVIAGDHHLDIDDIFLHRTKRLPPIDDDGVVVAAAFISYCSLCRVIDAIKVGDWLLHHGHTTVTAIESLALSELWRDGAHEAIWILDHLDGRHRSLKESETGAVLKSAGLPAHEVNVPVDVQEALTLIGDLVYVEHRALVEFEGVHHQTDRRQYNSDIDRYAVFRAADVAYVQATSEKLAQPKILVGEVYRMLVARGYQGPPPSFGDDWKVLFTRLSLILGSKRGWLLARARGEVS